MIRADAVVMIPARPTMPTVYAPSRSSRALVVLSFLALPSMNERMYEFAVEPAARSLSTSCLILTKKSRSRACRARSACFHGESQYGNMRSWGRMLGRLAAGEIVARRAWELSVISSANLTWPKASREMTRPV